MFRVEVTRVFYIKHKLEARFAFGLVDVRQRDGLAPQIKSVRHSSFRKNGVIKSTAVYPSKFDTMFRIGILVIVTYVHCIVPRAPIYIEAPELTPADKNAAALYMRTLAQQTFKV